MQVYEELVARGLIAQVTDEERIRDLVNNGKAVFYIGFDPTADSLHVGHFMALCLMKRLQMAGNKPIARLSPLSSSFSYRSFQTDLRSLLYRRDCTDWRRYSNDRRSVWKDRYEKDDDKGDNRA